MAACDFIIPFSGEPEKVLNKAKSAVQAQGGTFNGNANAERIDADKWSVASKVS